MLKLEPSLPGKPVMTILKVDAAGRVQFPEAIREEFGLTDSAQLSLVVRDGAIVLVPLMVETPLMPEPTEPKVYHKGHVLVVEPSGDADIDINQFIEDLREERIQEQMGL
jgi:bifunctional DNA-binding transcriptional regulator/antitoxin component of YhaV-PrlF toxin-antitoxin module